MQSAQRSADACTRRAAQMSSQYILLAGSPGVRVGFWNYRTDDGTGECEVGIKWIGTADALIAAGVVTAEMLAPAQKSDVGTRKASVTPSSVGSGQLTGSRTCATALAPHGRNADARGRRHSNVRRKFSAMRASAQHLRSIHTPCVERTMTAPTRSLCLRVLPPHQKFRETIRKQLAP